MKKHSQKSSNFLNSTVCNSEPNENGPGTNNSEPNIGPENDITSDINDKSISIDKTDKVENIVIDSSDYSNTSCISKNTVINPVVDCQSPMDTSQNELPIHKGEEPGNVLSGKNSRKNSSIKNGD